MVGSADAKGRKREVMKVKISDFDNGRNPRIAPPME